MIFVGSFAHLCFLNYFTINTNSLFLNKNTPSEFYFFILWKLLRQTFFLILTLKERSSVYKWETRPIHKFFFWTKEWSLQHLKHYNVLYPTKCTSVIASNYN